MSIEQAVALVEHRASQVGFARAALPSVPHAPTLPISTAFWTASYAQLLLMVAPSSADSDLRIAAKVGQEWLDLACMQKEQIAGKVIDGYVLILMESPPTDEVKVTIHSIELDPRACRKHFAWPDPSSDDVDLTWQRIYRVTALGIPESPETAKMTGSPLLLSSFEKQLLADIKEFKATDAARRHANLGLKGRET